MNTHVQQTIAMHSSILFSLRTLCSNIIATLCLCHGLALYSVEPPKVLDPEWQIELITSEPELVTPVGCCFDDSGRLLVIECHTHFPPDDYDGPKEDRIYLFEDSDSDGVLDRKRLFYEGGKATMGLAPLPGGWIAVSSRSKVMRIRRSDGDRVANEEQLLLELKTSETYPHNGLTGLALGGDGWLYVGQGENLGKPYELVAADDTKQIGGGEGGNIFRCRIDGSQLERVATGFWNPFGMYLDPADRLWAVGNDPDAMPPCRLLHVVPGGDYGFQFRFGRAGTHPLQSWNGEFPGTLPMAAGTGEAPCAVVGHGGHLWVTSWGDNRVERYRLAPRDGSWQSETEVIVQGDAAFRPVGMAVAPDQSIYLTDWADRSYPLHGKGRLWRLSRKPDAPPIADRLPSRSKLEEQTLRLLGDSPVNRDDRLRSLNHGDPFVRQAAAFGMLDRGQLEVLDPSDAISENGRVGLLSAWRWKQLVDPDSVPMARCDALILEGLRDDATGVVLAALRWATELGRKEHLDEVRALLDRPELSPTLFSSVIASIAYLETGSAARGKRDPAREKLLYEFAANPKAAARLRSLAIRMLPPAADHPTDDELGRWATEQRDRKFAVEVIRLLAARSTPSALDQLARLAGDESLKVQTRADAVAGLARHAGQYAVVLNKLSLPRSPQPLRQEARRVLSRTWIHEKQSRPRHDHLDAWDKLVGSGGDPAAGRRVFFRTTCWNCHAHSGRGASTGPDLTNLAGRMTSKRLLESIFEPSKEVGPLYVPWRVLTTDGHVLTGLKLDRPGVGNSVRFQGADGMTFDVPLEDIEDQEPIKQSIMPTGLADTMSIAELRDLVAFLVGAS